jgi:hypothetical protein
MAKTIYVTLPRSAVQELENAPEFASQIREAALESETTGAGVRVKIGKSRKSATVSVYGKD